MSFLNATFYMPIAESNNPGKTISFSGAYMLL